MFAVSVCHECTEWPRLGFTVRGNRRRRVQCTPRACARGHSVQPSPNAFGLFFVILLTNMLHNSTSVRQQAIQDINSCVRPYAVRSPATCLHLQRNCNASFSLEIWHHLHNGMNRETSDINISSCWITMSKMVVSLVHSRHYFGNFVLVGHPAYLQRRLQSVLNAEARSVPTWSLQSCLTLLQLYIGCVYHNVSTSRWLSWRFVCCMVLRHHTWTILFVSLVIITTACSIIPAHNRRSTHISSRASLLWNSLPSDIQSSPSLPVFRQRLTTFFFHNPSPT